MGWVMGWSEFEMTRKNTKLNNAKLKTLPLGKSVCDSNNLYFTRTGDGKGKFTYRYQRLGRKHEMGLGPWPALTPARRPVTPTQPSITGLTHLPSGGKPKHIARNMKAFVSQMWLSVISTLTKTAGPTPNMPMLGPLHLNATPTPYSIKNRCQS